MAKPAPSKMPAWRAKRDARRARVEEIDRRGLFTLRVGECFVCDRHSKGKPCMVIRQFIVTKEDGGLHGHNIHTEILGQTGAVWRGEGNVWVVVIPMAEFDKLGVSNG